MLRAFHNDTDPTSLEIGIDEAGRGPLFGRVYAAAVALPRDGSFDCSQVKDSKKYHSTAKIEAAADYVKTHALAWSVQYLDETAIDRMNILEATQECMHNAARDILSRFPDRAPLLLVDGNVFRPLYLFCKDTNKLTAVPHTTVTSGDNTYAAIAAASILAKVARDQYIAELCAQHPYLCERYQLHNNKGYGAKVHLDGIRKYGLSPWHRKTFGICKSFSVTEPEPAAEKK